MALWRQLRHLFPLFSHDAKELLFKLRVGFNWPCVLISVVPVLLSMIIRLPFSAHTRDLLDPARVSFVMASLCFSKLLATRALDSPRDADRLTGVFPVALGIFFYAVVFTAFSMSQSRCDSLVKQYLEVEKRTYAHLDSTTELACEKDRHPGPAELGRYYQPLVEVIDAKEKSWVYEWILYITSPITILLLFRSPSPKREKQ